MKNNIIISSFLVMIIFITHSLDNKKISKGGITNRTEADEAKQIKMIKELKKKEELEKKNDNDTIFYYFLVILFIFLLFVCAIIIKLMSKKEISLNNLTTSISNLLFKEWIGREKIIKK